MDIQTRQFRSTRWLALALLAGGMISALWPSAFARENNKMRRSDHDPQSRLTKGGLASAQASTLTGRVLDQNNTVVAGAVVTLTKSDGAVRQTVTTGSTGAFSFENLPAGSYRLFVSRQGFAVRELSVEAPFANGSLEITLKPDAARYSITVTAANDSFAAVEAVSATRMPLPLSELPQSVGVVDRAVIDSEQAVRIADAARNVSGVERDTAFAATPKICSPFAA